MIGKAPRHPTLFDVGNIFDLELPADTFHAQLAQAVDLVSEADFADLYCEDNGRPSIPPVQLVLLMILQYHERLSDQEAVDHSAYDLRWSLVLRKPAGKRLCGRSTLVEFRARLALKDGVDRVFDRVLQRARERGLLPTRPLRVLMDTRAVVGRGAVEDTYNLLGRAMDLLLKVLSRAAGEPEAAWAEARGLERYVRRREASLKGQAEVNWENASARRAFLREVVTDARKLLALANELLPALGQEAQQEARTQMNLLEQILRQDVDEESGSQDSGSAELHQGTAKDRVASATDPDQRHGHKSHRRQFTGHKARIAVEEESGLILDAEVIPGNAADAQGAVDQVQRVAERCGEVEEVVGDSAYAGVAVRAEFAAGGQTLRAKQPRAAAPRGGISKSAFVMLFDGDAVIGVRCPHGREATQFIEKKDGTRIFSFRAWCARCPLRHRCVQARWLKDGRTIQVNPRERMLQDAREYQQSEAGQQTLRSRVGVEHAFARLARLGIGQARYFGRARTRVQMVLASTAVNLRLLLRWEAARARTAVVGVA